ncbi:serine hydrolase [Mesorhizobium sp.]|uniref:serine hydrolase n=1 Tax=Mesorhizobium sp. TaxID=1871066 RepID=UPI0025FD8D6F|nr:serine hydrolase [Mesorhizobium sp.]
MPWNFDEKKIDAIFSQIDQCHKPGAAVGIAIDGRPIYRKRFGLANMELPVVLSPSIRVRIYSMT